MKPYLARLGGKAKVNLIYLILLFIFIFIKFSFIFHLFSLNPFLSKQIYVILFKLNRIFDYFIVKSYLNPYFHSYLFLFILIETFLADF